MHAPSKFVATLRRRYIAGMNKNQPLKPSASRYAVCKANGADVTRRALEHRGNGGFDDDFARAEGLSPVQLSRIISANSTPDERAASWEQCYAVRCQAAEEEALALIRGVEADRIDAVKAQIISKIRETYHKKAEWNASHFARRVFGDKREIEHSGTIGRPEPLSRDDALRAASALDDI